MDFIPFTGHGVEAASTLQISRRARAAEPLIFHHQKKSRELWKFYNLADNDVVVVQAVRLGILKPGDISAKTAEAIQLDRHLGEDKE